MRCVICHCEPVSAPAPLRPGNPLPWEISQDPALVGRGLAAGKSTSSSNTPWKRGSGIPPLSQTPGCPPPRRRDSGLEKGGLKDQASFLLPFLGDGPRPPPSLRAAPRGQAGTGGAAHSWAGGWERWGGTRTWLPYRQLGAAQGVWAACGGSSWAGLGGPGLCRGAHLGTAWHSSPWLFHPLQQRNRRGKPVGKVNCKNMKQDCPVPTCPRATLLPGHCCHTCPKGEASRYLPVGTLCIQRVPRGHRKGGTAHIPPKGAACLVMGLASALGVHTRCWAGRSLHGHSCPQTTTGGVQRGCTGPSNLPVHLPALTMSLVTPAQNPTVICRAHLLPWEGRFIIVLSS